MSDTFERAQAEYARKLELQKHVSKFEEVSSKQEDEEERLNSSGSSRQLNSDHSGGAFESARRFLRDEDDDDPDEVQDTFSDQKQGFNRPSSSGPGLGGMKDDWDSSSIIRGEEDAYAYGNRSFSSGPYNSGSSVQQGRNNANLIFSSVGGCVLSCWHGLAEICSNLGDHVIELWIRFSSYSRRQKLVMIGILTAIILAVVMIATFATGGGGNNQHVIGHPTLPPGTGIPHHPIVPLDPERYESVRRFILDANLTSVHDLDDRASYQNRALHWVVENDVAHVRPESLGLLQRYALAALFFGTYVASAEYESQHPPQAAISAANGEDETIQWKSSDNWMSNKGVCEWYGVQCVDNIYSFEESSDGNMNIVNLDLSNNNVEGHIPSELRALNRLTTLMLSGNSLFGSIPETLGDLENLVTLNLHDNRLTGSIPGSLGRCAKLHILDVGGNELNGPVPSSFESLSVLRFFNLGENMLTGSVPKSMNMTHVEILQLNDNEFKGTIPTEYGSFTSLTQLNLRNNKLHGEIPSEVGRLNHLKILTIGFNQLTGTIPVTIETLISLTDFEIPHNKISGPLPEEIGALKKMESIRIEGNRMTGTIPDVIGTLEELHSFHFFKNNFTGHVPDSLCDKNTSPRPKHLVADCVPGGGVTCNCCNRCYR